MHSGDKGDVTKDPWLIPLGYFVGLIGFVVGSFGLLFTYAFASMVNPSWSDAARRQAVLEKMFLRSGISEGTYVSILLILASLGCIYFAWIAQWRRHTAAKIAKPQQSIPVIDDGVSKKWTANQEPQERIMKSGGELKSAD